MTGPTPWPPQAAETLSRPQAWSGSRGAFARRGFRPAKGRRGEIRPVSMALNPARPRWAVTQPKWRETFSTIGVPAHAGQGMAELRPLRHNCSMSADPLDENLPGSAPRSAWRTARSWPKASRRGCWRCEADWARSRPRSSSPWSMTSIAQSRNWARGRHPPRSARGSAHLPPSAIELQVRWRSGVGKACELPVHVMADLGGEERIAPGPQHQHRVVGQPHHLVGREQIAAYALLVPGAAFTG